MWMAAQCFSDALVHRRADQRSVAAFPVLAVVCKLSSVGLYVLPEVPVPTRQTGHLAPSTPVRCHPPPGQRLSMRSITNSTFCIALSTKYGFAMFGLSDW